MKSVWFIVGTGSGIGAGTAKAALRCLCRDEVRAQRTLALSGNRNREIRNQAHHGRARLLPKPGSDALDPMTPAVEARLQEMCANELLSKSTDVPFRQ
jgi:NAD(P)-dependent dehydrogenase (short-subunit alcohol dehydrogenase family)